MHTSDTDIYIFQGEDVSDENGSQDGTGSADDNVEMADSSSNVSSIYQLGAPGNLPQHAQQIIEVLSS